MRILKQQNAVLIEQYSHNYIRYDAGQDGILQLCIGNKEAKEIIEGKVSIDSLLNENKERGNCSPERLRGFLIRDFLRQATNYAKEETFDPLLAKFDNHQDLYMEFYNYVLNERFSDNPIVVKKFTAKHFAEVEKKPVWVAYQLLIHLRESDNRR